MDLQGEVGLDQNKRVWLKCSIENEDSREGVGNRGGGAKNERERVERVSERKEDFYILKIRKNQK